MAQINTRNMYSSHNIPNSRRMESNLVANNARNTVQTGIVPLEGFNQNILNNSNTDVSYLQNQNNIQGHNNIQGQNYMVSPLSGQRINVQDFTHNNMQPFFGGQVRQNINANANKTLLEKFTGTGEMYHSKKEVKNLFDVTQNMGNVFGSPNYNNEEMMKRYIPSQKRQNELPIEQIRVGPGLNQGYTAEQSGGFTQANARDFVMPKSVDEMRVLSNPKLTYQGRIINGLKSGQRGLVSKPKKNRPETYYKNTPDRYFKTGGAFRAAKIREKVYAKPTHRRNTRSYYGAAGPTEHGKPEKRGAYRKSHKQSYRTPKPLNPTAKDKWKVNDSANQSGVGDYGKTSIENKKNERQVTGVRTHTTNLVSYVKALITPVQDMFRQTRKENFIGNSRPDGTMKAQMPPKMTVYDPDDVARTTMKETSIHNDREGNISGPSKLTVYDPDDVARTTIKETNIHNEREGNMSGPKKLTVYDPEEVARTTIKETNIHHKAPHINMSPQQPNNLRVYDPNDIPRTTMKETGIHNSHSGNIQHIERSGDGGYSTHNVKMRNTNKQFTSDYEYTGVADGDVGKGGGRGYLAAKYKAKNTHKQFLSNNEYKGSAGFYNEGPMSYSDHYNARLNPNKEKVARGRAPTEQGAKVAVGEDMINMYHRKIEADQINVREPAENRVYQMPPRGNNCGMTNTKDKLPEDMQRSRMNPDILDAYRSNPYTKPLDSVF